MRCSDVEYIFKEAQEKLLKCNLLPIHEFDRDWEIALSGGKEEKDALFTYLKEQLARVKGELLHTLPNRFKSFFHHMLRNCFVSSHFSICSRRSDSSSFPSSSLPQTSLSIFTVLS